MQHRRSFLHACLAFAALVTLSPFDAAAADDDRHPQVVLDTSMGTITLELDREKAPITVDNFLKYVDSGYYNGMLFHRVIDRFMIQGGGFKEINGVLSNRQPEGQLAPIKNEAGNGLSNQRGTIAMARTSDPNSATSQFFINLVDNSATLDRNDRSAGYAVFGKAIAGMDVVDKIAKVSTHQTGPIGDIPDQPITIRSAKRKK